MHPTRRAADVSFVSGTSERPLLYRTVDGVLKAAAAAGPERLALRAPFQSVRLKFAEFDARVEQLARGLIGQGLKPGDRIGLWAPNCAEWVLMLFAASRAGLVLVNINPAYRQTELEFALRLVGCRALVFAPRFKSSDYGAMLGALIPELSAAAPGRLACAAFPELRLLVQLGTDPVSGALSFEQLIDAGRAVDGAATAAIEAAADADQVFNIQFTSGTTGTPKGATLTHFNIVNNGFFAGEGMRLTADDRVCIPVPLYHCFGMVLAVLACVSVGSTMVFPGEAFDPAATLAAVDKERCTALHGVPTMFIAELDLPNFDKYDLSRLRTGIMAGSPCPIETMKRVVAKMNLREITIAYGMTETSPVSFQSSTTDPLDKRTTTVGQIQPHLEVKLVDPLGEIVPVGETGELCTRGYSVMKGYWGDEEKTREAIIDGWMHTGDLATLDAEGYCNIVGRLKDMLIRGGENIYPREIEEFLFRHPKIQSAQVFGVPDIKYGEEVCAWIVLRQGEHATAEDIREFCQGQIAHYKIPRHIRFVDELPMTVTGKIQKFIMRAKMIDELKLSEAKTA